MVDVAIAPAAPRRSGGESIIIYLIGRARQVITHGRALLFIIAAAIPDPIHAPQFGGEVQVQPVCLIDCVIVP